MSIRRQADRLLRDLRRLEGSSERLGKRVKKLRGTLAKKRLWWTDPHPGLRRHKGPIAKGTHVKTVFTDGRHRERMWVRVEMVTPWEVYGALDNAPVSIQTLHLGQTIRFPREHVIEVLR